MLGIGLFGAFAVGSGAGGSSMSSPPWLHSLSAVSFSPVVKVDPVISASSLIMSPSGRKMLRTLLKLPLVSDAVRSFRRLKIFQRRRLGSSVQLGLTQTRPMMCEGRTRLC